MQTNIIVMGPPNSGKSTISSRLAEMLSTYHLSTGNIIRDHIVAGTDFGTRAKTYIDKGELVPDELMVKMVENKIIEDMSCIDGVVLDGFPRTLFQAQALSKIAKINAVIYLDVDDAVVVKRALDRRVCPNCKKNFSITNLNGQKECDVCGSTLISRVDANETLIKKILQVYKESTLPLIDYYTSILIQIDANQSEEKTIQEVWAKLSEALKNDSNKK